MLGTTLESKLNDGLRRMVEKLFFLFVTGLPSASALAASASALASAPACGGGTTLAPLAPLANGLSVMLLAVTKESFSGAFSGVCVVPLAPLEPLTSTFAAEAELEA